MIRVHKPLGNARVFRLFDESKGETKENPELNSHTELFLQEQDITFMTSALNYLFKNKNFFLLLTVFATAAMDSG